MKNYSLVKKLFCSVAYVFIVTGMTIFSFAQPGTLDSTFGSAGKSFTNVSSADDEINAAAIQSDNKIIVAGYSEKPSQITVARYNVNGSLDTSFGTNGIAKTSFNTAAQANAVVIQSDGKIVVGGKAENKFVLVRYTSTGQLDSTFGSQGKVLTTIGSSSNINDIVIQDDGKIIAAGFTEKPGDFAVARYATNGTLDSAFGTNGIFIYDYYYDDDGISSIKLQYDGKIVLGGYVTDGDINKNVAVVRLNSNGTFDTTFNGSGLQTSFIACGTNPSVGCEIKALAIQGDGKIITTGSLEDIFLARYNANGSVDTTFGSNGIVISNLGGSSDTVNDLIISPSGGVLVTGSIISGGNEDMAVASYLTNGVLDTTFDNGDGIVSISLGSNSDISYSIAIQPNGGIILGGSQGEFNSKQFASVRLNGFQPTTASAEIAGRVTNAGGSGLSQVRIALTDSQGNTFYTMTNSFGYYIFSNLAVGQTYILTAHSKTYTFTPSSRIISLNGDYAGADFVGN